MLDEPNFGLMSCRVFEHFHPAMADHVLVFNALLLVELRQENLRNALILSNRVQKNSMYLILLTASHFIENRPNLSKKDGSSNKVWGNGGTAVYI